MPEQKFGGRRGAPQKERGSRARLRKIYENEDVALSVDDVCARLCVIRRQAHRAIQTLKEEGIIERHIVYVRTKPKEKQK